MIKYSFPEESDDAIAWYCSDPGISFILQLLFSTNAIFSLWTLSRIDACIKRIKMLIVCTAVASKNVNVIAIINLRRQRYSLILNGDP